MTAPVAFVACMLLSVPALAQHLPTTPLVPAPAAWTISATAQEEAIGHGLPMLALDRPDWPSYRSDPVAMARTVRSVRAELGATHPSGWRLATLARAEAWLQASADTVTIAALDATKSNPAAAGSFSLNARGQSWQGQGIKVGTPWWTIDTTERWHWQADVQLLRLQQLLVGALSGNLRYSGAGVYDFNLQSQRSNINITDPYLPPSASSGMGTSLSLALKGTPAPGWQLELRADDIFSRLAWSKLATETAVLNSQVTSRASDGSLNYAAVINGRNALLQVTKPIGVHWQARFAWSAFQSSGQTGALTLHVSSKAGINQYWLGWNSASNPAARTSLHWSVEFEPTWQATRLAMAWGGAQISVATDGRGLATQYRQLKVTWKSLF